MADVILSEQEAEALMAYLSKGEASEEARISWARLVRQRLSRSRRVDGAVRASFGSTQAKDAQMLASHRRDRPILRHQ